LLDNTKIKLALPQYKLTNIQEGIKKTYAHIKEQLIKKN